MSKNQEPSGWFSFVRREFLSFFPQRMTREPACINVEGFLLPQSFNPVNTQWAMTSFVPRHDDIIVAGYPNSGLKILALAIYVMRQSNISYRTLPPAMQYTEFIPLIEWFGPAIDTIPTTTPRVLRTHLPYYRLSEEAKTGGLFVYVIRNPKDCLVLSYEDITQFGIDFNYDDCQFDDFVSLFLDVWLPKLQGSDYYDHLLSWRPYWNKPNVNFVLYEEFRTNPRPVIIFQSRSSGLPAKGPYRLQNAFETVECGSARGRLFELGKADQSAPSPVKPDYFSKHSMVGYWRRYITYGQSRRLDLHTEDRIGLKLMDLLWKDYYVFPRFNE